MGIHRYSGKKGQLDPQRGGWGIPLRRKKPPNSRCQTTAAIKPRIKTPPRSHRNGTLGAEHSWAGIRRAPRERNRRRRPHIRAAGEGGRGAGPGGGGLANASQMGGVSDAGKCVEAGLIAMGGWLDQNELRQ